MEPLEAESLTWRNGFFLYSAGVNIMQPESVKYLINAQDMNRAVGFYRDTMGFSEGFISADWSELRFGDAILGIHGGGDGSRNQTGLSIQFENVEAAYAAAIENGARPVQRPEQREGEPIILSSIIDPEGNVIMLTQYLG
jgi:predicted enzyme related to lactoylglutathione lyase